MSAALYIRPHGITKKSRRTRAWYAMHGEAIATSAANGSAAEGTRQTRRILDPSATSSPQARFETSADRHQPWWTR